MCSIRLKMDGASTGSGTQAFAPSGMTETPKLAIVAMSAGITVGSTPDTTYQFDIGSADGTVQRAMGVLSRNGSAAGITTQGGRYDTATCLQHTTATSNAKDGSAAHSSFSAGTHTIDYDNTDTLASAFQVLDLLIGGSDVTFETVEFASDVNINTEKDAPTLSTITNPNFVFVYGRGNAAFASESNWAARSISIGFAILREDGTTTEQWCISDVGANNATSARTRISNDRCAKRLTAGGDQGGIQLTTWKSNTAGFTTRDVGEVTNWVMLFGKFTNNRLRAITGTLTAGSSGDKTIPIGWPTKAYCMVGSELGVVGTSSTGADASKWSYGWVDEASTQSCLGVQMEPSAATGDSRSIARNDHIVDVLDDAGAHSWSATHVSKDTANVVVNVDDTAGGDRAYALLSISEDFIAPPGAIPAATRRFRRQLARM